MRCVMGFKDADLAAIATFDTSKNIYLTVVGKGKEQHLEAMERNFLGRLWMKLGISDSSIDKVAAYVNGLEFDKDGIQALRERAKDPELGQKFSQFEQKLIKHIQNTTEGPPSLDVVGKAAIRMVLLLNEKEYPNMKVEIEEWIGILDKEIPKLIGSKDSKASSQLKTLKKERTELQEQLLFSNLAARNAAVSSVSIPIITETNKPSSEGAKKEADKDVSAERTGDVLPKPANVEAPKKVSSPKVEEQKRSSAAERTYEEISNDMSIDDISAGDFEEEFEEEFSVDEFEKFFASENRLTIGSHALKSESTQACIDTLVEFLGENALEIGVAADTGDCFFDAVAQGLVAEGINPEANTKVVRQDIKDYLSSEENTGWFKDFTDNYDQMATYQEILQEVGKSMDDLEREYQDKLKKEGVPDLKKKGLEELGKLKELNAKIETQDDAGDLIFEQTELMGKIQDIRREIEKKSGFGGRAPTWGIELRDGKVLSEKYKVNIEVYSVQDLNEDENEPPNPSTPQKNTVTWPQGAQYENTIRIALYPGHFVPVWEKK